MAKMQDIYGPGLSTLPLSYATIKAFQSNYPGFNEIKYPNNSLPFQLDRKTAKGFGIVQIIIGIICLILNVVAIRSFNYFPQNTGFGIWGGILIFFAGLLQVMASYRTAGSVMMFGAKAMCIVASFICIAVLAFAIIEATDGNCYDQRFCAMLVTGIITAILSFIAGLISIKSATMYRDVCDSLRKDFTPTYIIINQPTMFQPCNPEEQIFPEVPHDLSPEALMNSGMTNNHPPSYEDVLNQVEKADESK